MIDDRRRKAVMNFVDEWRARGSEVADKQAFWLAFLRDVLGVDRPEKFIRFEVPVKGTSHHIDAVIPVTRTLIEHKSRGVDLDKPAPQSDGSLLTPFEQAWRYTSELPYSEHIRWIVTCNFDQLRVYDLYQLPSLAALSDRTPTLEPRIIYINRLARDNPNLQFLIDPDDADSYPEIAISKSAAAIIGELYEAFARNFFVERRQRNDFDKLLSDEQLNALNKLCVRIVFCLYAEDAALFRRDQFIDYLKHSSDRRRALIDLFTVLNQPEELRAESLSEELSEFPYVDGALFDDDEFLIPPVDKDASHRLLVDTVESDDGKISWYKINPTIFGALFESTLDRKNRHRGERYDPAKDIRRAGGMHYTSVDNIHKVIDPLFLDELHAEFKVVRRKKKNRRRELEQFQDRLAALTFLDPACGSGNFLTATYISLRELENDVLRELQRLGVEGEIKVSIDQFYGIEIHDFACAVAQTAMWISEHQMMLKTEEFMLVPSDFLPLKHSARIVCGNALELDWREVVPGGVDYIIGNPPFSGARMMRADNKADLLRVFDGWRGVGNLDLVAAWFKRAADFMIGKETRTAFVATNSVCQGETVAVLWKKLFETVHIDFAHRMFRWTSESDNMASVHCVIVGFSAAPSDRPRIIFDGEKKIVSRNINAYLLDAPNFYVESRSTPLCDVPKMSMGSMPNDGGNLIIEADEYEDFVRREPRAQKYIRRFVGAKEFINGKERWCLWLKDATEDDLRLPLITERVEGCRRARLSSRRAATRKLAATPSLFGEDRQPHTDYLVVPITSSELRRYIPMGFFTADVITNAQAQIIEGATLYHFGVLESSVHMAWMRAICGRLEVDYRYSGTIVYNNYPWCGRSARIEETARGILDARSLYRDRTLASLYDPNLMPSELRAAHEANDRAVLSAYGFDETLSEDEIVSRLMSLYQHLSME